jgi:hypothetical protein
VERQEQRISYKVMAIQLNKSESWTVQQERRTEQAKMRFLMAIMDYRRTDHTRNQTMTEELNTFDILGKIVVWVPLI